MSSDAPTLKRVPLDALHRELGARMGGFAGYDMPIQYPEGLKVEHLHTRSQAGLFDVSHMGQLRVTGASLHRALEAALPIDFDTWPDPDAQGVALQKYSYLLNDEGGIEDDLMLVKLRDEVRIIVNAGNRASDLARLQLLAPQLRFEWIDAALLALQGPAAESVLAALDPAAASLKFMQARTLRLLGVDCFATRSGYTGEDGYEISVPSGEADKIARALLKDAALKNAAATGGTTRVKFIGLGARDTLRLEAGLPLHGNDIGPTTTPVQAGLQFAIPKSRRAGGTKAGGFPGAATVLAQLANGSDRKLVGLVSDEAIPIRAHTAIVNQRDQMVGEVTSGTVSPSLGKPVMLAYVDSGAVSTPISELAPQLRAVVRDKRPVVQLAALPFVAKRYKR